MSCVSGHSTGRDAERLGVPKVPVGEFLCLISNSGPGETSPAVGESPTRWFTRQQGLPRLESREEGSQEGEPAPHLGSAPVPPRPSWALCTLKQIPVFFLFQCFFCVVFFKVLAICLTFSHPCWDLRPSLYFTTWSWQAPLVEIQTEATWWGNRHKNINLVDIKKNHAGYKSGAVHWFLSSSKWSF